MKICNKCKITKEDEQFRLKKDTNGKYYRYYICKECERIDNKERCKKYIPKTKSITQKSKSIFHNIINCTPK